MNASTSSSASNSRSTGPADPSADTRVRFSLSGVSRSYDPARQAIRPDLADVAEAAHHFAPHYAEAADWQVTAATVLRESPSLDAAERASLAVGDSFALLDLTGGWAWGYAVDGHVVGYVEANTVGPAATGNTAS